MPFTVYIDDSGTDPNQAVAIASALIIPASRILLMESEWRTLKEKEGFSEFHTSEFVARNPKSQFANWDDAKLERVFKRVRQIAKKYGVQAFSFSVKKDDYEQCVPDELRQYCGKHYTWAIRQVVVFAQRWRIDRRIPEPYEWLFDWMNPRDAARAEIDSVMEQAEEEARTQRGVEHDYTHYDFRPRSTLAGLQCADLLAWTNYNFSLRRWAQKDKPMHPYAQLAWDDFASMPNTSSPSIHNVVEWNFFVAFKRDNLEDWAKRELADGRSLIRFREWHERKQTLKAKTVGDNARTCSDGILTCAIGFRLELPDQ